MLSVGASLLEPPLCQNLPGIHRCSGWPGLSAPPQRRRRDKALGWGPGAHCSSSVVVGTRAPNSSVSDSAPAAPRRSSGNRNRNQDDVITWERFPHYWPFVWGIQRRISRTKDRNKHRRINFLNDVSVKRTRKENLKSFRLWDNITVYFPHRILRVCAESM